MDNFELKGNKNPKIVSKDGDVLKFCLSKKDLDDPDTFDFFIRACEKSVRSDTRYKEYISVLKELGYTKDVIQPGIDTVRFPNTKLEMHHGPLFTMYDICAIVTDHMLKMEEKVNTFKVAKRVLKEHELGRIQIVMGLTKTNHEAVHDGKIFIHINQAIGDVMGFIEDFKKGFRREHLYTMEKYLKLCHENDATDNDFLVLRSAGAVAMQYVEKNKY